MITSSTGILGQVTASIRVLAHPSLSTHPWGGLGPGSGLHRREEGGSSSTRARLQGQGHSRVVDDLQALSLLEGQIRFGPGLVIVEGHKGGDSTCDTEHSGRAQPPDPPLPPASKTQTCSPPGKSRRPHHHTKNLEPKPQRPNRDPLPYHAQPQPTPTRQRPGTLRRRDRVGGVEASKELGLGSHGPEGAAGGAMGIGSSRLAGGL